jgi:hypothetical protein
MPYSTSFFLIPHLMLVFQSASFDASDKSVGKWERESHFHHRKRSTVPQRSCFDALVCDGSSGLFPQKPRIIKLQSKQEESPACPKVSGPVGSLSPFSPIFQPFSPIFPIFPELKTVAGSRSSTEKNKK